MTSRLEKERAKQIQDKCQNLLNQMLRDEDNKYCVDCDAKGSFVVKNFRRISIREWTIRKSFSYKIFYRFENERKLVNLTTFI